MGTGRERFDAARNTEPPTRRQFLSILGRAAGGIIFADTAIILSTFGNPSTEKPQGSIPNTKILGQKIEKTSRSDRIADETIHHQSTPVEKKSDQSLIEQLKAQRSPDDKRNDELETKIALEVLKEVNLTKEGYENFKANIVRSHMGIFERANLLVKLDGQLLKRRPRYFIYHQTAHVYAKSTETILKGMLGDGHSIPWIVNRDSITSQITTDPLLVGFQHAKDFNMNSSGVEIETWPGKKEAELRRARAELRRPGTGITSRPGFQGDLTAAQYEQAAYLGIYNVHELWSVPLSGVLSRLVGHREINDRTGQGTPGKPDFNKEVMDPFRSKISKLLPQLTS